LVAFWRSELRTDASGRLSLRIALPPGPPRWRVEVIAAAGATRIGSARTTIAAPQPVLATLEPPPALTVGDVWPASVLLHNRSAQPALVTATLRLSGLQITATQVITRQARLDPGATQRLSWPVVTGDVRDAGVAFTLEMAGAARQELVQRIAVRPARGDGPPTTTAQAGATVRREYFDPANGQRIDPANLRAGQLVGVRVSVIAVRPLAASRLVAPLPAGFELVSSAPQPPFGPPRAEPGELLFALRALGVGIHTQEYLVRAALPGHFIAPAPQLVLAGDVTIVGNSQHVIVE
ncbi:MAG: hypothetical protein H7Y32_03770, partial [Chloroflexales bacterium]|nr:hypothetical protein [Chloroflexales bacterium]